MKTSMLRPLPKTMGSQLPLLWNEVRQPGRTPSAPPDQLGWAAAPSAASCKVDAGEVSEGCETALQQLGVHMRGL